MIKLISRKMNGSIYFSWLFILLDWICLVVNFIVSIKINIVVKNFKYF